MPRRSATSEAAAAMARKRWEGVSPEDRKKHQKAAADALWAGTTEEERKAEMKRRRELAWEGMTPEERSAEMRRRRLKGLKNAKRAKKPAS